MLESPGADFGRWVTPPERDGVLTLPWFEFGPVGEAWRAAVGAGGWVIAGFDWRSWLDTAEGLSLAEDPDAVARATPDQLERLLTAIVRSDRFVEGSIEGAFTSGLLARISRRTAALLDGQ